ncbi:MAG: acyl-CoA thioesterase [Alphaproteobacteria bacterium]
MIDIYKGMANTWECDENGHLNVRFYVAKVREGLSSLWHEIGLTRAVRHADMAEMVVVDKHLRFLREVRPGQGLYGRAGILDVGENYLRVYAELANTHSDAVAATFNMLVKYQGTETGDPKTLPDDVREAARAMMVALPDYGAPRSIPLDGASIVDNGAPLLADTDEMSLFEITRGLIQRSECDAQGRLNVEYYIGRISDGIVNLSRKFRPVDTGKERSLSKYGGAVLEYRLRFHQPLRENDLVVIRSGLKHVGDKANTIVHWTFNGETGQLISTSEAVAITLDLEARKVVPLSGERRTHLESLVVPGLAA